MPPMFNSEVSGLPCPSIEMAHTYRGSSEYARERMVMSMKSKLPLPSCILCESQSGTGISILGTCICPRCEAALVASKATSSGYDIYVKSLRAIWQGVFPLEPKPENPADSSQEPLEAVVCLDSVTG